MKSKVVSFVSATILFASFGVAIRSHAQGEQGDYEHTRYVVHNLGTFGGTISGASSINNFGWATGFANLKGDKTQHAAVWIYGLKFDLGTLGGPNSAIEWPQKNNHGVLAGISETPDIDPLGEQWSCSFFFPTVTGHTCVGFFWEWGKMSPLPTLGGNNGYAAGINNREEVAGWAETTVHDSTCVAPQVLQFEPVVWGPGKDKIRQLPMYHGDPDGAATAINDKGQVVGISGICGAAVGEFSAAHALLWESGTVTNIGSLGGVAWNTPTAINNRGVVIGFSDLRGDKNGVPNFHAFRWTKEDGMHDLGTLPGDAVSQALGINERGQIVGESCQAGFTQCRAFLWEDGKMTDLNTSVANNTTLHLVYANDINDRGEIAGGAVDQKTGQSPAFVAIPKCDADDHNDDGLQKLR